MGRCGRACINHHSTNPLSSLTGKGTELLRASKSARGSHYSVTPEKGVLGLVSHVFKPIAQWS